MSDFLTRLAERTLGVAPTVQPVLAPLFAPSPLVAEEWTASDVSGFVAEQDGDVLNGLDSTERTQVTPARETRRRLPQAGPTHSTSAVRTDVSRPDTGIYTQPGRDTAFEQTNQAMTDVRTDVSRPPTGTYTQPGRDTSIPTAEQTNQVTTRPDTGIYTQPGRDTAFEQTNQAMAEVGTDVSRPGTGSSERTGRDTAFEQTSQVTAEVGTDVSRPPTGTYTQPERHTLVPTASVSEPQGNIVSSYPVQQTAQKSDEVFPIVEVHSTQMAQTNAVPHFPDGPGSQTSKVPSPSVLTDIPEVRSVTQASSPLLPIGPGVVQHGTSMRMEHAPSTTLEVESIPSEHAQIRGASQQEHMALVPPGKQRIAPHVTPERERVLPEQTSVVLRNEQQAMPTPELSVPAPTIQVTIGRIEVRAVTSPVTPARPKPSRPSTGLSLDDYLDQYNGRKR